MSEWEKTWQLAAVAGVYGMALYVAVVLWNKGKVQWIPGVMATAGAAMVAVQAPLIRDAVFGGQAP